MSAVFLKSRHKGKHMARSRSYSGLIKRLQASLSSNRDAISIIGEIRANGKVYPMVKITLGKGNRILISAGIHGDEPAGVDALYTFLKEKRYKPFIKNWELTIIPCINPLGYESETRKNNKNIDLNRKFKAKYPPREVECVQSVFQNHFDLTLELHEDRDSPGYYLYQAVNSNRRVALGRQILSKVRGIMPINTSPMIEGMPAEAGVIKAPVKPKEMKWWPMAIYALAKGANHCLTLETATRFPLKTRVAAHLLAIETALKSFVLYR